MSNFIFRPKTADLPSRLTSYDFLKTAAIVLMVIDHVGYFFFPEDMWFRAVGRLSAPIWFFLIGYAKSRDIGPRMWIAAAVLVLWNWVTGYQLLPLSIIATMIVFRLLLDPLMAAICRKPPAILVFSFLFFLLAYPSAMLLEYGSAAMLIVMAGYMTRNRESLPFDKAEYVLFCLMAAVCFLLYQVKVFFFFNYPQQILAGAGIMAVMLLCMYFRPVTYDALTAKMPAALAGFFRVCGRRTLEIYVLHLIAFKGIAIAMGFLKPDYFNFHIF